MNLSRPGVPNVGRLARLEKLLEVPMTNEQVSQQQGQDQGQQATAQGEAQGQQQATAQGDAQGQQQGQAQAPQGQAQGQGGITREDVDRILSENPDILQRMALPHAPHTVGISAGEVFDLLSRFGPPAYDLALKIFDFFKSRQQASTGV